MPDYQWMRVLGLQFEVEAVEPAPPVTPSYEQWHVLLACPSEGRRVCLAWTNPPQPTLRTGDILRVHGGNKTGICLTRISDGTTHLLKIPYKVFKQDSGVLGFASGPWGDQGICHD